MSAVNLLRPLCWVCHPDKSELTFWYVCPGCWDAAHKEADGLVARAEGCIDLGYN